MDLVSKLWGDFEEQKLKQPSEISIVATFLIM